MSTRRIVARPSRVLWFVAALALSAAALGQAKVTREVGPTWTSLNDSQRAALAPLQDNWSQIDAERKEKWVDIAARFPRLSQDERERVQTRMTEWAKLSPRERGDVRLRYRDARQLAPQGRQARWDEYQALPEEQRRELAARAAPSANSTTPAAKAVPQRLGTNDDARPKANIVPNPALAGTPKTVSPSVVKAQSGATTTLITTQAAPPAHQQAGLPKIAATPEFVNRSTLLPQRGLQGAATSPAAAASAAPRRK